MQACHWKAHNTFTNFYLKDLTWSDIDNNISICTWGHYWPLNKFRLFPSDWSFSVKKRKGGGGGGGGGEEGHSHYSQVFQSLTLRNIRYNSYLLRISGKVSFPSLKCITYLILLFVSRGNPQNPIIVSPDESRGYLGFSTVTLPPPQRFPFGPDNLKNILVSTFKFGMWVYM